MDSDVVERKRVIFLAEEKNLLKRLICKNYDIIECKKTDGSTIKEKKRCWEQLTEEFNRHSRSGQRTIKQLKKLWDNLKCEKKKELASQKREEFANGWVAVKTSSDELSAESDPPNKPYTFNDFLFEEVHNPDVEIVECQLNPPSSIPNPSPSRKKTTSTIEEGERVDYAQSLIVQNTIQQERELHQLVLKEQRYKVELAEIQLAAAKEEIKLKRQAAEEELLFKKKKWELELRALSTFAADNAFPDSKPFGGRSSEPSSVVADEAAASAAKVLNKNKLND